MGRILTCACRGSSSVKCKRGSSFSVCSRYEKQMILEEEVRIPVLRNLQNSKVGFTLAELLIALAILGEIATFTIPKILSSQQNAQNKAVTKEVFAMMSGASQTYSMNNTLASNTSITAMTQYMNYVSVDTTSTLDGSLNDSASYSCTNRVCLKLHSGAIIAFAIGGSFGGTSAINMQWFLVDPDGSYKGDSSSVWGALYYNGRLTSWANITPSSQDSWATYDPGNYDPAWFSW